MAVDRTTATARTCWLLLSDVPLAPPEDYNRPATGALLVHKVFVPYPDPAAATQTEYFWRTIETSPTLASVRSQLYSGDDIYKQGSLYLSAYTTFSTIVETSWYGAFLNMMYGPNPVNLYMAALDLGLVKMGGSYLVDPLTTLPGEVALKIESAAEDQGTLSIRAVADAARLPVTVTVHSTIRAFYAEQVAALIALKKLARVNNYNITTPANFRMGPTPFFLFCGVDSPTTMLPAPTHLPMVERKTGQVHMNAAPQPKAASIDPPELANLLSQVTDPIERDKVRGKVLNFMLLRVINGQPTPKSPQNQAQWEAAPPVYTLAQAFTRARGMSGRGLRLGAVSWND